MNVIKTFFRGLFTLILVPVLVVILVLIGVTATVKATVLSPAFVEKEVQRMDVYGAVKERLGEEKHRFTDQIGSEGERIYNVVEKSFTQEWMNSQIHNVLGTVYPYIKSETNNLDIRVSLAGLKESMKTQLRIAVYENPPEGMKDLPVSQVDEYLDDANAAIDDLPGEVRVGIEHPEALDGIRSAIKAFNLLSWILIALAVFLALLLAFLHFRVKDTFRVWGYSLLLAGACSYAIAVVGVSLVSDLIFKKDLPSPLTPDMILIAVKDFLATPRLYGIILGVAGLALIVLSFFFREQLKVARKRKPAAA